VRRALVPLLALAFIPVHSAASSSSRPIIVYRPAGLSLGTPVPLVIALHGRGGDPGAMEQLTHFDQLADQNGFVVAYLKSAGVGWDAASWTPPDDLQYIDGEIDQLVVAENIDPMRVFVAGTSSGAFMAYRVACNLSLKVAAIVDVSGGMANPDLPLCRSARPMSVLSIHGDSDPAVPLQGKGKLAPLSSTLARWRKLDRCPIHPELIRRSTYTISAWSQCLGGSRIELILIQGGAHGWPGSDADPSAVDATANAWSFFAKS
jgi:polyhydroxybutyrate depolymerase